jgi:predicted membrane channel-forming protein YqfA (hemolysin III family)
MPGNWPETIGENLRPAIAQSIIAFLLAGMVLDYGVILRQTIFTLAIFWAGVLGLTVRRNENPTRLDIFVVRWGLLILLPFSLLITDQV